MQYTLIGRKRTSGALYTVTAQYGTDTFKKALAYAQRIWQTFDGYTEWEALECRCENNGDLCEACEVFNIYK